jgi:predicted ester cyclase
MLEGFMRRVISLFILTLVVTGCDALPFTVPQVESSSHKNKIVVRGYLEEIINKGNWNAWNSYFPKRVSFNGRRLDSDGFHDMVGAFRASYPDFRITIEEQIAEGDKVMTRLTCRGTQMGKDEGIAATRREVTYSGIAIDRIRDGKVIEMWYTADVWSRIQQLR